MGAAVLIFFIARWLARRARTWLHVSLPKANIPPSMSQLAERGAYYGILFVAILTGLALIGVPIEALLGASLIIVVILGVALQQSIANLAATIVFLLFQPFRLGELIKANGVLGTVKEIQFFSTVLVTGDNLEVTIPNAKIQGDNLLNYTRLGRLRIDFVFGVELSRRSGEGQAGAVRSSEGRCARAGRSGAERVCADAGRQQREFGCAALGEAGRLLDAAMGYAGACQGALRCRGDQHSVSAARRASLTSPIGLRPRRIKLVAFWSSVWNNVVTSSAVKSSDASPTVNSNF